MPSRTLRRSLTELSLGDLAQLVGESTKVVRARLFESPAIAARPGRDGVARFPSRAALERVLGTSSTLPSAARARRDKADAELKELELKVRTGELVHRSEPARGYLAL